MGTARIFVIDDDRDSADMLAALVSERLIGRDVALSYDASSALGAIVSNAPDAIVSDLDMLGMGGHELALRPRVRRLPGQLLLIAASGIAAERAAASASSARARWGRSSAMSVNGTSNP